MDNPTSYEVLIIGSGGGAKIAQALNRLGHKTALIEKDRAGGTCLNRGCIPSKMLIHPASVARKARDFHKLKLGPVQPTVDFEALIASINTYTDGISDSLAGGYAKAEFVDYYQGEARFVGDKVLEVGEHRITAEKIIIATGSRPHVPNLPGLAGSPFMTSTEALRSRRLPPRLIVIGGGYIAAELGGAYAGFGCDVTFVLRSTFLKREDPEIIDEFKKVFYPGKTIYENADIARIRYREGIFSVMGTDGRGTSFSTEAEALLVATGVKPNTDMLGLDHTAIQVKPDGFIHVDEYLQTSVPGIYAIGDVAGNYLFRHSVNFEAEYWVDAHYLKEHVYPIHYPPVPGAVFTHPEIASVGLTESEARAKGLNIIIGRATYSSCAMSVARGLEHGMVKLVFSRENGQLLGAHIVGEEASTMVQELVLAATHELKVTDIYRQIYIHPAFPEVVRNAVRDAMRRMGLAQSILF